MSELINVSLKGKVVASGYLSEAAIHPDDLLQVIDANRASGDERCEDFLKPIASVTYMEKRMKSCSSGFFWEQLGLQLHSGIRESGILFKEGQFGGRLSWEYFFYELMPIAEEVFGNECPDCFQRSMACCLITPLLCYLQNIKCPDFELELEILAKALLAGWIPFAYCSDGESFYFEAYKEGCDETGISDHVRQIDENRACIAARMANEFAASSAYCEGSESLGGTSIVEQLESGVDVVVALGEYLANCAPGLSDELRNYFIANVTSTALTAEAIIYYYKNDEADCFIKFSKPMRRSIGRAPRQVYGLLDQHENVYFDWDDLESVQLGGIDLMQSQFADFYGLGPGNVIDPLSSFMVYSPFRTDETVYFYHPLEKDANGDALLCSATGGTIPDYERVNGNATELYFEYIYGYLTGV